MGELLQIASSNKDVLQAQNYGQLYSKLEEIMIMACEEQYPGKLAKNKTRVQNWDVILDWKYNMVNTNAKDRVATSLIPFRLPRRKEMLLSLYLSSQGVQRLLSRCLKKIFSYVQDWTLMRFKFLVVSITKCPHWYKVTTKHEILSDMKEYNRTKYEVLI